MTTASLSEFTALPQAVLERASATLKHLSEEERVAFMESLKEYNSALEAINESEESTLKELEGILHRTDLSMRKIEEEESQEIGSVEAENALNQFSS
jgi:uncharacterized tellurite resistance protein B-like protein